jgi:3-hydroxyacyl-CoA dehydrogenase
VATAEDIELGIKSTFGFRMHHEGPMLHYDLAGIWKWPADVRTRVFAAVTDTDDGAAQKIRERAAEGSPWFIAPEEFEQATALRDSDYVRRFKELYWRKEDR